MALYPGVEPTQTVIVDHSSDFRGPNNLPSGVTWTPCSVPSQSLGFDPVGISFSCWADGPSAGWAGQGPYGPEFGMSVTDGIGGAQGSVNVGVPLTQATATASAIGTGGMQSSFFAGGGITASQATPATGAFVSNGSPTASSEAAATPDDGAFSSQNPVSTTNTVSSDDSSSGSTTLGIRNGKTRLVFQLCLMGIWGVLSW